MLEGEFNIKFGHGQVFCSCGKVLSICKCHKNYHIALKACKICVNPPNLKLKRKKAKGSK